MKYEKKGKCFYFEPQVLPELLPLVSSGVITDYGRFILLSPLPEVIGKGECDYIIIDGKMVPWESINHYTINRLKAVFGDESVPDEAEILGFYQRKYDEDLLEKEILLKLPNLERISFLESDMTWFGFSAYM